MKLDRDLDQNGGGRGGECLHLIPAEMSSPWNSPCALHSSSKTKQNSALQPVHVPPVMEARPPAPEEEKTRPRKQKQPIELSRAQTTVHHFRSLAATPTLCSI